MLLDFVSALLESVLLCEKGFLEVLPQFSICLLHIWSFRQRAIHELKAEETSVSNCVALQEVLDVSSSETNGQLLSQFIISDSLLELIPVVEVMHAVGAMLLAYYSAAMELQRGILNPYFNLVYEDADRGIAGALCASEQEAAIPHFYRLVVECQLLHFREDAAWFGIPFVQVIVPEAH